MLLSDDGIDAEANEGRITVPSHEDGRIATIFDPNLYSLSRQRDEKCSEFEDSPEILS
jgi:hypothetical protein